MAQIPAEPVWYIVLGLVIVGLVVLSLPFKVRKVEENLELFFLIMGAVAVTISGLWSFELIKEAVKSPVMIGGVPIGIFQVVLLFGILVYYFHKPFYKGMIWLANKLGYKIFVFLLIIMLGLFSSIISVIVAASILAEVTAALPIEQKSKIKLVVTACFAMGLGAVLTPIGEPLSTILVHKLAGPPYNAGFSFPLQVFGKYIVPGVIAIAIFGVFYCGRGVSLMVDGKTSDYRETLRAALTRAVKVYAFVAPLALLGEGLRPVVVWYFDKIPSWVLYWLNMTSAILDNAALAAIEIDPTIALSQIIAIIMGLAIAGGMLVPGNIPNIVAASRLRISMKEWARIGIPIGLVLMAIYFIILLPTFF